MAIDHKHREEIADAVTRALESGADASDVREEVEYAIDTYEEEA